MNPVAKATTATIAAVRDFIIVFLSTKKNATG
jgi:hypothetical protein